MKRLFDVVLSSIIAVLTLPAMLLIAGAVKLTSRGPVFFTQQRVGRAERPFRMWKFRTMKAAGAQALQWSAEEEQRITRVGHFLRDYGLDELPQLWNILNGDMSIIGPRPPLLEQLGQFDQDQRRIFSMRPGVLSLAAIKGRRSISPVERIRYHLEYVERWSLALDLEILWRSLFVVLRREAAVEQLDSGRAPSRTEEEER